MKIFSLPLRNVYLKIKEKLFCYLKISRTVPIAKSDEFAPYSCKNDYSATSDRLNYPLCVSFKI